MGRSALPLAADGCGVLLAEAGPFRAGALRSHKLGSVGSTRRAREAPSVAGTSWSPRNEL